MTPQPSEQPRTAAGRALLDSLPLNEWHPINREIVIDHILAIEAEAVRLLKRWRNASLDGDLDDMVDLTNETTDLLGDGNG